MDLASTRVFGITELTVLIASFLDEKDISRLLQASHGFHDMFSPSFYNEVDFIKDDRRLAASPDAMLALSRNAEVDYRALANTERSRFLSTQHRDLC